MWWLPRVTYFVLYVADINGFSFFTNHLPKRFLGLKLDCTSAIVFYGMEINFLRSARRFITEGFIHWNLRSVVRQFASKEVEKKHRDLLKLSHLQEEYYQSNEVPPLPLTHPHRTPFPFPETGMCHRTGFFQGGYHLTLDEPARRTKLAKFW